MPAAIIGRAKDGYDIHSGTSEGIALTLSFLIGFTLVSSLPSGSRLPAFGALYHGQSQVQKTSDPDQTGSDGETTETPQKPVTSRKPNTNGRVMVLMYHHILEGDNTMFRSARKFRRDLENLRNMGFRPVSMTEYVTNTMKLPKGASPVVITFDDAHINQFRYLRDGKTIDPNCAVGIWLKFAKEHPDFPVKGMWYVLPDLWHQPKLAKKKIDALVSWGSEIGNHTVHHKDLRKLSEEQVKEEIAGLSDLLEKHGITKIHFAPPYGSYPANRQLVKEFEFKGKTYKLESSVLAGSAPSLSPNDKRFDPYRIWRVHGNGREMGIDDYLNQAKAGKWQPYVAK